MALAACADPGAGAEQPAFAVASFGTMYTGLSAAPASRNALAEQAGDVGVAAGAGKASKTARFSGVAVAVTAAPLDVL